MHVCLRNHNLLKGTSCKKSGIPAYRKLSNKEAKPQCDGSENRSAEMMVWASGDNCNYHQDPAKCMVEVQDLQLVLEKFECCRSSRFRLSHWF